MQTMVPPAVNEGPTELVTLRLNDDFYRDGFRLVWLSIAMIVGAIGLLITVSLYFFLHQVVPVHFNVYEGFRVQPDIPVSKPYLHIPDLAQWVSSTVPLLFATDFINYNETLQSLGHYFTPNGWGKYETLITTFLNKDNILAKKLFVSVTAGGAPVVLNQGIIEGKYSWWVQMPINVRYSGVGGSDNDAKTVQLVVQTLISRVPTFDNLDGVAIDNIIVNRK